MIVKQLVMMLSKMVINQQINQQRTKKEKNQKKEILAFNSGRESRLSLKAKSII